MAKKKENEKDPKEKGSKAEAQATPTPAAAQELKATEAKSAEAKAADPGAEGAKKRKKQPGIPPRRGRKLRSQLKQQEQKVRKEGSLPLKKALTVLRQTRRAKFDETVEVHLNLGIDPTQADQMIRGSVALPNGVGKTVRVLVFAQGANIESAKKAGADIAGGEDIIKKITEEGWLEFDVALATQDMMAKVIRLGKVLGPRGLMPTPKAGTVIPAGGDVSSAVKEFKAGKVEYRTDKGGNVHAGVGKISFDDEKLAENIHTFIEQIRSVKPSGVKGNYILGVTIAATMSPGIPVAL